MSAQPKDQNSKEPSNVVDIGGVGGKRLKITDRAYRSFD